MKTNDIFTADIHGQVLVKGVRSMLLMTIRELSVL